MKSRNLPIVHHLHYDVERVAGHRFPMGKYRALRHELHELGFANFHVPEYASEGQLKRTHDPDYVDQVLACTVPSRIERKIGFPVDGALSRRVQASCGGTLLAARLAMQQGLACNAAGGSHHAHRDFGAGYCVFNDVAVASLTLLAEGAVTSALVIDCDVHQGDGTADILGRHDSIFTFSLHCGANYPLDKKRSHHDVELRAGTGGEPYLATLSGELTGLLESQTPDLVFYNAGVDVHADDLLGKLKLSDADIRAREELVIGKLREKNIPACIVMGGGYSNDVQALARRHAIVFEVADQFV